MGAPFDGSPVLAVLKGDLPSSEVVPFEEKSFKS